MVWSNGERIISGLFFLLFCKTSIIQVGIASRYYQELWGNTITYKQAKIIRDFKKVHTAGMYSACQSDTHQNALLGLTDKGRAITGLVVCSLTVYILQWALEYRIPLQADDTLRFSR